MLEARDERDSGRWWQSQGGDVAAGARTPEELETLLEDALLLHDGATLAALFEERAVLVAEERPPVRGGEAIAERLLALWAGERSFVADPRRVLQAGDIALIVAERTINVMRREQDGTWRYAIAAVSFDDAAQGRNHGRD